MIVVTQCSAYLVDALNEAVIGDGRVRPDRGHQRVLGDETIDIFHKVAENGEALRPEDDRVPRRVAQGLVGEIDGDPVDGEDRVDVHSTPPPRLGSPGSYRSR